MPKKLPKLGKRKKNKKELQRQDFCPGFRMLNTNRTFTREEFQTLLEESNFVPKILEAYRKATVGGYKGVPDADLWPLEPERNLRRHQAFIEKYLAEWLYQAADLLIFQAPFACGGNPISRENLSNLILYVFIDQGPPTTWFKYGRKQIWDRFKLLWALSTVLPEINSSGTLTLATVAKKINAFAERRLQKMGRPLTEKHLQKLFKEHDIDWKKIKEDHKEHLGFKKKPTQ